tara:strand:+ start:12205 stop:13500 length:1296 start_codon:yes stop_codon:yes gene_type:complete
MSNRYLDIRPSNSNASQSYRDGRPVISFTIAEGEDVLIPSSVRFCGKLHVYKNSARARVETGDTLAMDSRLGMWSVLDQVVISSATSKQTIEHIRHANRFYSSYLGLTSSEQSMIGHFGETGLSLPSTNGQKASVVEEGVGTNCNEFCIHIPTGLLSGTSAIPLSRTAGVGGLTIDLYLAPDSMVLFDTSGDASAAGYTDAFYELTECKLVCETHSPTPEDKQKVQDMGGFEYNSISGYYSTINSTNANINFSLGLSRVESVFMNFLTSSYLNNLDQNSLQTINPMTKAGDIANVDQVVFTKGGARYPLDYNVDTQFKLDKTNLKVDPQVIRNFMNSVVPFNQITHTSISPVNTNKRYTTNDNSVLEGGALYGIGVAYDILGSPAGGDFTQDSWGVQMDLGMIDDNPTSAFIFVHSKNTVLFKDGQIQVVQ